MIQGPRKAKQQRRKVGLRRLYRDGRTTPALFHEKYRKQLLAHFGELDGVADDYSELVAYLRTALAESMKRYATASDQRETGRGRRPNLQAVNRLSKRAALDFSAFDQSLRRLEQLAGKNGHAPSDDLSTRLLRLPILSPSPSGQEGDP